MMKVQGLAAERKMIWGVLLLLCLAQGARGLDCSLSDSVEMTTNPIGSCYCDGQLWIGPGCHEGYWCESTSGVGCYKSCPDGEFLATDFINDYWECVTEAATPLVSDHHFDFFDESRTTSSCPTPDGYFVCPSDGEVPTPIPEAEVTENPLGTCRCNGEIWLAEGCAYGFYCDDTEAIGGVYLFCEVGENLHVNFDDNTWFCDATPGNCPGGEILGTGCPVPICQYSVNPFGDCGCDDQLFISNDCTEGFICTKNLPNPFVYDGCIKRCLNGQIVVPDFENLQLNCVDAPEEFTCPGSFELHCADNDVGNNFDSSFCECDGQMRISSDCREGYYCLDRLEEHGASFNCEDDEILDFNFVDYSAACTTNLGNCPTNMGGFELGCPGDGGNPIPPIVCEYAENTIGDCLFDGQIWVNDDCTESFFCSFYIPNDQPAEYNGCGIQCPDGERVHLDLVEKEWECVTMEDNYVCPGRLQTDFNPSFSPDCVCANQIWMHPACTTVFHCEAPRETGGPNVGQYYWCNPGYVMHLDFIYPPSYTCVPDEGQCPGSFHFGCDGGDFGDLTTTPHTTEGITETTTQLPYDNCNEANTNDLGVCDCEGQYYVNDDCTESFFCTDRNGGEGCELQCAANERVQLDFNTDVWVCVTREADFLCPGQFETDCAPSFNVQCGCMDEIWINGECSQGFVCNNGGGTASGDFYSCPAGEVINVDLLNGIPTLECVADNGQCPGSYHYGCNGGDFGDLLTTTAEPVTSTAVPVTTTDDMDTTPVDPVTTTADPITTDDPSETIMPDTTTLAPLDSCQEGSNTIGSCSSCESQFFVNQDCSEGFLCTSRTESPSSNEGCSLDCNANSRVPLDFEVDNWECVPREAEFICPGAFETDCYTNFEIDCECSNQVWVNGDCSSAFTCRGSSSNAGEIVSCGSGEIVSADFSGDLTITCIQDNGQCPGSYHFGCDGGDFGQLTTPAEVTTTPVMGGSTTEAVAGGTTTEPVAAGSTTEPVAGSSTTEETIVVETTTPFVPPNGAEGTKVFTALLVLALISVYVV